MTYVDAAIWPYRRMMMCHLFADSLPELHAMAEKLGVRRWFQNKSVPHYDICKSKRAEAIQLGAKEITRRETVEIIHRWKKPMKLKRKVAKKIDWNSIEVPAHLRQKKKSKIKEVALKRTVTKWKPEAAKTKTPVAFTPDQMGERYQQQQQEADVANVAFAETKTQIIATAAQQGKLDGNKRLLKGQRFEVGFIETDPAPKADPQLCKHYLPPKLYKLVAQYEIKIDEKALEQLVDDGEITPALLKKLCKKPASQRRIHVRAL